MSTTWDELSAHVRSSYAVVRDEPQAIAISWRISAGDQQLVQGVGLAPMEIAGRPWLTMIADLFAEVALAARTAVLYQDRLPFGALVLREGVYLLRHGLPLGETTFAELDWTVRLLAHEAAQLRVNAKRFGPTGDPFSNFAD